ncbi:GNAT family N-acetyltransferase [Emticicia sp. BO119]|uniref:GNAT family N-acetyltransferase n=1 Tax=Emticicia sp. BO119 TaxID=2757768 RepID=UPI0015F0A55E|nr:GNAT family N-acetyltransferase [Emticicia sp. BO119]MBA4849395.1 GNAT family N-acetyltransferase [Emticicia sp. BO119]
MYFRDLKNASEEEKKFIYNQYCLTFPIDERRNEEQFYSLFQNENTCIFGIDANENAMGYFVTWPMNNFLFVEFFEIYQIYRSTGVGARALDELKKQYKTLVLETEPSAMGNIAKKRIEFYERNGFYIADPEYMQPAYDITKNSINLYLMATEEINLNAVKVEIYNKVYGVKL